MDVFKAVPSDRLEDVWKLLTNSTLGRQPVCAVSAWYPGLGFVMDSGTGLAGRLVTTRDVESPR
jgi:hypothetical protein